MKNFIKEPLKNVIASRNLHTSSENAEPATKTYQEKIRRGAVKHLQPKCANCSSKHVFQRFPNLILFGMQGSGKGTQGKLLAKKFHLSLFETGAELRKLAKEKSTLGGKIKTLIEKGHLVPNEVVMEMIEDFMKKNPRGQGVIFDGIPRKKEQAESFNTLMKKLHLNFLGIFIEISEKEAMKRLEGRRICEQCHTVYPAWYKKNQCEKCKGKLVTRTDDTTESIKNRIEAYKKETLPVIDEYYAKGKLIKINGEQSIKGVQKEISLKLSER